MSARSDNSDDVALSLTMAVVASSPAPLLLLDGQCNIVAASRSFYDTFGDTPATFTGLCLYAYGDGEWDIPQLRSLLAATISGAAEIDAYEIDLRRVGQAPRHLVVQARRLSYLDLDQLRILVAVSDITDAKADAKVRDDALRQNGVLLLEVRHRVANSLQIIASVLLQNARKTQSDETRGHLHDAHHRVMSVAALERLLSASEEGDVQVHTYFTNLCDSIAASMIGDTDRISLSVEGGGGTVDARVSVSLGLIVTELVINALKHAFPDGRVGRITVDYNFQGPNWILCVRDDGVGMQTGAEPRRTGLGTSIVQALAGQLNATVTVIPEHPGTQVSIEHVQIALIQDELVAIEPIAEAIAQISALKS
jgi:two-component sensor histidine kinase